MNFLQFKKTLKDAPCPIYLFFGDDIYFVKRSVELLNQSFVTTPELNYNYLNFEKPSSEQTNFLLSNLQTPPLMSDYRLVVVDGLLTYKDLEPYFENPQPGTILALIFGNPKFDYKKYDKICAVDCNRQSEQALTAYIMQEFSKSNANISQQAAKQICVLTANYFSRISTETQKLLHYALATNQEIDIDIVNFTVSADIEYKLWEFADAAAKKDFEKAYKVFLDSKQSGVSQGSLLFRLYAMYKNMFEIAISNKSDGEIAKELGIKEYAVKMQRQQAKNYTKKQLRIAVETFAQLDADIKSGQIVGETQIITKLAKTIFL